MNGLNKLPKGDGEYIVFEGGESCGKSTIWEMLRLEHPDWLFVREPGTTPLAMEMRKNIFAMERDDITDAYLFATARADLYAQVVIPALKEGKTVVSDRSFLTSMVYQGYCGSLGFQGVYDVNRIALNGILPTKAIIFALDYETSQARVRARGGNGGEVTYFDRRAAEFYTRAQEGYKALPEFCDDIPFEFIDASKSITEVYAAVEKIIIENRG